jgi:hypothetical protein
MSSFLSNNQSRLIGSHEEKKATTMREASVTCPAEQQRSYQALSAQADQVYASGTFAEITRQRVQDMNFICFTWPFMGYRRQDRARHYSGSFSAGPAFDGGPRRALDFPFDHFVGRLSG